MFIVETKPLFPNRVFNSCGLALQYIDNLYKYCQKQDNEDMMLKEKDGSYTLTAKGYLFSINVSPQNIRVDDPQIL